MNSLEKCRHWFFLLTSALGLFVGLAGFFVFNFTFSNYQAGFLAGFSGLLSAVCLHLAFLHHYDRLTAWYTPIIMRRITIFATVMLLVCLTLMVWYLYSVVSKHQGFYPVETSNPARAVMSFLCVKWAGSLVYLSVVHRRGMLANAYQNLEQPRVE